MNITVSVLTNGAQAELAKVKAQLAQVQGQLAASGRVAGPGSGRQLSALTKYGNQLQWTGRQLQYNFTLPIALAAAAATKFAMDNEKAFTRISKVYGDAGMSAKAMENELNSLKKAFVALSNHYGVHQKEVLNIAADWAAAGASGVALARGVEQTLRVMVLGEMDAAKATEALISIQAQYNLSSEQLVETIAKLNIVENQTGISLQGLIEGFQRAAGVARESGVDVEHLAAMLAALTPAAGSAAQAGNALKTILSRLQSVTPETRDLLDRMGIAVDGVAWKSANGAQKVELLSRKFHDLDQAQKGVVSATLASRYQINKFEALMDSVYKKVDNNVKTTGYYGRALEATADRAYYLNQAETELRKVLESNPQKFKQIWVILENAMADIIVPMIPLILMAATTIKNLVEAFRDLPLEVQKAITLGFVFLALFGPLIRYIGATMTLIGELTWFLGGLAKSLLIVFRPLKLVGSGLSALGAGYMALRGVFLGVTAALLSGSRVWSGVLTAIFGRQAATKILGAAIVVNNGFKAIYRGIISFFINLVPFIFLTMGKITRIVRVLAIALPVIFAEASYAIAAVWRGLGAVLYALSYAAVFAAGVAWRAGLMLIAAFQAVWTYGIMGAWRVLQVGLAVLTAEGMALIRLIWARGLAAIQALLIGFAAFAGGLWRAMLAGIQTMTLLFTVNLGRFFAGLIPMIRAASLAVMAAMTGPWGIAITAVVALLVIFRKQIAQAIRNVIDYFRNLPVGVAQSFNPLVKLFHQGVAAIVKAFYALPKGVRDAMMAVVRIVHQAVLAVYKLFSYLNPFAHHSPSLVENVTNGMAEVKRQFASITDIAGPIKQAYNDIKKFGQATAGLAAGNDAAKRAGDRASIGKVSPGALAAYDALISDLKILTPLLNAMSAAVAKQQAVVDGLKASLDAANAALDVQQKSLDALQKIADAATASLDEAKQRLSDFANTPIAGMRAMEDQIFANEMAQKQLRLEMLKMDDAVGGIDKLKDKMNALSGQIELLSGEQEALRSGGAGSEILKQYDDQIQGLEDQQDGIKDTIKQYDNLSDELERLQRAGEKLDLEKSLKFDELTRQIDQAANAMQEMPFDEIMAGIQQANADIAKYTTEVEKANAAVDAQKKVVDAATAARDAIQAQYDAESAKLDVLKDKYTQVETAIRDINTALQDMTQAAEDSIRRQQDAADKAGGGSGGGSSPALDNFNGAAGGDFPDVGGAGGLGREGGLGDQSKLIDDFTKELSKKTGDLFASFDIFGPIKEKWNKFTAWWGANVNPAFASAAGGVKEIWSSTIGAVDWTAPFQGVDWGKAFGNIKDIVKDAMKTAADWGKNVWKLFADDIKAIWETIKQKFKEAIDKIAPELASFKKEIGPATEALKALWDKIKPIAAILGGILLFALKLVTSVLKNTLGPALDAIIGIFKGLIRIVKGVVQVIIGIFTGDLGKIKEGVLSILNGLWTAVWAVIKGAALVLWGLIKGLVEGVVDFFKWLLDVLVGHSVIPDMVNAIIDWFKKLWDKCVEFVKGLAKAVVDKWNELWQAVKDALTAVKQWIETKFEEFKLGLTIIWKALTKTVSDKWNELWQAVKDALTAVKQWVETKIEQLKATLTSKWENLKNTLKAAWDWVWDQVKAKIDWAKGKIDSAINGIKAIFDNLKKGWQIIVDDIKKKVDDFVAKFNAIKNKFSFSGMFDGIKSAFKSAINWLIEKWNNLSFPAVSVGGVQLTPSVGTPNIGYLAKGGMIARHAMAVVGEGRAGYPEYVIPTDPMHRRRAMALFSQLGGELGATLSNAGGMWRGNPLKDVRAGILPGGVGHAEARANAAANRGTTAVSYGGSGKTVIIINGNLEFPNIKSGDDADSFISHLETLAGGGGH